MRIGRSVEIDSNPDEGDLVRNQMEKAESLLQQTDIAMHVSAIECGLLL